MFSFGILAGRWSLGLGAVLVACFVLLPTHASADSLVLAGGKQFPTVQVERISLSPGDEAVFHIRMVQPDGALSEPFPVPAKNAVTIEFRAAEDHDSRPQGIPAKLTFKDGRVVENASVEMFKTSDSGAEFQVRQAGTPPGGPSFPVKLDWLSAVEFQRPAEAAGGIAAFPPPAIAPAIAPFPAPPAGQPGAPPGQPNAPAAMNPEFPGAPAPGAPPPPPPASAAESLPFGAAQPPPPVGPGSEANAPAPAPAPGAQSADTQGNETSSRERASDMLFRPKPSSKNKLVAGIGMTLWIIGLLAAIVGGLWTWVLMFQTGLLWGLSQFLPCVAPVFLILWLIRNWSEGKIPFFVSLGGAALMFLGLFVMAI